MLRTPLPGRIHGADSIDTGIDLADPHISYPINLERWLMEGSYR
jgi:hypothetical protein